jgi:hypothetical protein
MDELGSKTGIGLEVSKVMASKFQNQKKKKKKRYQDQSRTSMIFESDDLD